MTTDNTEHKQSTATDPQGRNEALVSLEYAGAIYSIFELMFEPWMDDNDKIEFMALTLQAVGKTFEDLDHDLVTGVANGFPVEQQVDLCRKLFSG